MINPETVFPTQAEFIETVRQQCQFAEELLAKKPESITPQLYIQTIDESGKKGVVVCALAVPFNEAQEKRSALRQAGRTLYSRKLAPLVVVLTCEAWMAQNPPPGVQPREFYGRKEMLIVTATNITLTFHALGSIPVKRVQDRIEKDGELDFQTEVVKFPLFNHLVEGFFEDVRERIAKEQAEKGFSI